MAKVYKTARGTTIDMGRLKLANENTIAVGNKKVNARGDLLGPGGKVIKTRAEIMAEKNKLHHSPIADDAAVGQSSVAPAAEPAALLQPTVSHDTPVGESSAPTTYVKPRGSFANSVASQTEVNQELLDPSKVFGTKPTGPQRL